MVGLTPELAVTLAVIALLSGIGITAIGPGGIFVTIALFSLTGLTPAEVAGTASATFIAAGLVGSWIYARSGELGEPGSYRLAALLSVTSVVGGLLGAQANTRVSEVLFGLMLGLVVVGIGVVIVYQEWRGLGRRRMIRPSTGSGKLVVLVLGLVIGFAGGLLGVGGPVLAVPALVVLGVPMLLAVAVAQVQSVFIAGFATLGYVLHDAVVWPLAFLIGVPELVGVVLGWRLAHRLEPRRLKIGLGIVLIAVGPYLAFG
ncbi:MAG: sulfite exporter TauE/SafE family protein [Gemmatimonadota bacterium]